MMWLYRRFAYITDNSTEVVWHGTKMFLALSFFFGKKSAKKTFTISVYIVIQYL